MNVYLVSIDDYDPDENRPDSCEHVGVFASLESAMRRLQDQGAAPFELAPGTEGARPMWSSPIYPVRRTRRTGWIEEKELLP